MQRSIKFKYNESKEYLKTHKGIYKLINTNNNHFYIGSTDRNFYERFLEHCSVYQKYLKFGGKIVHPLLGNAYNKYGIDSFMIEILEVMDDAVEEEIHAREGYYIRSLHPEYNVCLEPEVSGSPNKGRKLTKEGKQHIAEKSSRYKHSSETLAVVTANNKANACRIKLIKDGKIKHVFCSGVELARYFKIKHANAAMTAVSKNIKGRGFNIVKENTQMKKILVHFNNKDQIFNSFNKCDKALNMGRGYTSTMYNKGNDMLLDKYRYEII